MDQYRMIEGKDISGFLKGLFTILINMIRYVITALKQFYITALLLFIVSLSWGIYKWYNTRMLYRSEMVCEFNNLSKKTYGEMAQKLDMLARSQSYSGLAKQLNIPYESAKEIVSIEGKNTEGSMLTEDVTATRAPMYFTVVATDNKVFAPLEKALLDYLNSNSPFRLQRNVMEADRINKKLEFLRKDISLVDSSIAAYIVMFKNINLHADTSYRSSITNLLTYKKGLEDELLAQEWRANEIKSSVELLYGFTPSDFPSREKNKILFNSIVLGLLLALAGAILGKAFKEVPNQ